MSSQIDIIYFLRKVIIDRRVACHINFGAAMWYIIEKSFKATYIDSCIIGCIVIMAVTCYYSPNALTTN